MSTRRTIETENPQVDEVQADYLEFLRQIFKVSERMDSGGLLLKHIYGGPAEILDSSEESPRAAD